MSKKLPILFLLLIGIFFSYKQFLEYSSLQKDGSIIVKDGYNINKIINEMKKNDYIKSERFTRYYYYFYTKLLYGKKITILSGEYEIKNGQLFNKIIQNFIDKKVISRKITIPEGLMVVEIIKLINNEDCLYGEKLSKENINTPEGYLMPDTYYFSCGDSKTSIINRMKNSMDEYLSSVWDDRDINLMAKAIIDKYDAIILASIIEREGKDKDELKLISSVIHNRLKKRMRIQSCATVEYEITRGEYKLPRVIKIDDIDLKGDFNTYQIYGLPKTAISCPGRNAIYATLHPDNNDYLFFMLQPDLIHHKFSKDFEQHKRNKFNSINTRNKMNIKNERVAG